MSYTAEISRSNPSCFLFLIDQSGSMADPFGGPGGKRKADGVADVVNRLLQNLVIKCAKSEGVRDYYHCLLYTSPSPRDRTRSRMPSSA